MEKTKETKSCNRIVLIEIYTVSYKNTLLDKNKMV